MPINHFHVIKDPVHGTMQFTVTENAWVKPFIDSAHVQRLRHIKQLGLGDFIFPGAVHSRFSHSLGCCYVANKIAQAIDIDEENRQLVMLACLLHDIGHGPFSHAFEGMFYQQCIRHEDWTPYFLKDYETVTFFSAYNRLNPRFPITEEKFHTISKMIRDQYPLNPVLADIVSSQLDADRFDYLLRDSHFCGVKYGEFDLSWMLHCMTIVPGVTGPRLGVTYKGIGVVEHYLMARRLMMRNIYHTHKKLALEFYLIQLLTALAQAIETYAPYQEIRRSRLGVFLVAVQRFNQQLEQDMLKLRAAALYPTMKKQQTEAMLAYAMTEVGPGLGETGELIASEIEISASAITQTAMEALLQASKRAFIKENYHHFKVLCDYDVFVAIQQLCEMEGQHAAICLAKRLYYRQMPKIWRLDHVDLAHAQLAIQAFKLQYAAVFQDWQIAIIRIPHQAYSGEEAPILVVNEDGRVQSIGDISMMIQAIANKMEQVAFLCIDQALMIDQRILSFVQQLFGLMGKET